MFNARRTREATCKLMDLIDDGVLSWEQVGHAALLWLSEDEVARMVHANELYIEEEDEEA